jgi:hypothetical protein
MRKLGLSDWISPLLALSLTRHFLTHWSLLAVQFVPAYLALFAKRLSKFFYILISQANLALA